MRFLRFCTRDPLIVTPMPFRDLRDHKLIQAQKDAELEREWRRRVEENKTRRAMKRLALQPLPEAFRLRAS